MTIKPERIKLGYKASAEQFGPQQLLRYGILAEEIGLDSVLISDHFQPWQHDGGHAPFALAWLAALGARTERIELGTSVLTPTFRYNPAVIAQAFGTLGCLFPGRVLLGVGSGEALNELAVADLQWPKFGPRFARLREAITVINKLWTDERVNFSGDFYQLHNATVYDRPELRVPILVAAGGPVMAKFAGTVADGFICTSGKGRELYADRLLPAIAAGRQDSEYPDRSFDKMIEIKLSWDLDQDTALANTRFWAPLSLTEEQKQGLGDPVEMQAAGSRLSIEQIASRWIVTNDPQTVVDQVAEYVDLGFNHLAFHAPGHDQERFLRTFATEVLPALRQL